MPVTILGLGNVLMQDDGFGPTAIHDFGQQYEVGPDVSLVDLGTPGLDLTPWLADADRVVILDTVKAAAPPGTLRVYAKAQLLANAPFARVSPHDPGVKDTLLMLEFVGRAPNDVVVIGVVPEATGFGTGLTDRVRAALPGALIALAGIVEGWGCPVTKRTRPGATPAWWTAVPLPPAAAGNPAIR